MSERTPGTWETFSHLGPSDDRVLGVIAQQGDAHQLVIVNRVWTTEADALLLAAAPDLLAACRLAYAAIDAIYRENPHGVSAATRAALFDAVIPIQAAIVKAEGRAAS